MSFASVLNAYCTALNCTNKEIAEYCSISASALSRYRSGERTPDADGLTIRKLARGITTLATERNVRLSNGESGVYNNLRADLVDAGKASIMFAQRLDAAMDTLEIRNSDLARHVDADPSYISRIRNAQRSPGNVDQFANKSAQLIARRCLNLEAFESLSGLVGTANAQNVQYLPEEERLTYLTRVVADWLQGRTGGYSEEGVLEHLLERIDSFDVEQYKKSLDDSLVDQRLYERSENGSGFYYGINEMRRADLLFFQTAARKGATRVTISHDLPISEMASDALFDQHRRSLIAAILRNKAHVRVIHDFERSFSEVLQGIDFWMPLYMSGRIVAYRLDGVHNRVFCRLNFVSDKCALEGESVADFLDEGRFYYTENQAELDYYAQKMERVLSKASLMLEVYREDDEERFPLFQSMEAARMDGGGAIEYRFERFKNLRMVDHPGECIVITKLGDVPVHFVIRGPQIRQALDHMASREI